MDVSVTISKTFVENLRGEKRVQSPSKLEAPPKSRADPDTVAYLREHAELRHAVRKSRRVGDLLLKRESEELEKIKQKADQLSNHAVTRHPTSDSCLAARIAVQQCCQSNPAEIAKCSELIESYSSCANKTFMGNLTKQRV